MLIDGTMGGGFDHVKAAAAANEAAGYAGLWTGETQHDPFLQVLLAAEATERVTLGTSIAIVFGRTPMTLANTAFDLARYSHGRFVLGLGSQVKPHIERRFSMPWSHPAAAYARVRRRVACHLGELAGRREARLPRRVLHAHADDTVLLTAAARVGTTARVPRRRREADDRGRRRGVRRVLLPRVHDAVVPPRGDDAGAGARPVAARGVPAPWRDSRSPGPRSPASGGPTKSSRPPSVAPRSRSRSTRRPPRTAACSSTTAGATSSPS